MCRKRLAVCPLQILCRYYRRSLLCAAISQHSGQSILVVQATIQIIATTVQLAERAYSAYARKEQDVASTASVS